MNPAPERTMGGGMSKQTDQAIAQGGARGQVPTATLETIRQLIPASERERGGERVLVCSLGIAQVTPYTLPGQSRASDTAMIRVPTLRELAKQIHWSYDATNKYVMVLLALGFLYRRRHQDCTELYVPLSPIAPPKSDLLDQFPKRRGKVNSFVRQIKRRLARLSESPARPSASPSSETGLSLGLLPEIDRILQDELGSGLLQRRLMLHIEAAVYKHLVGEREDCGSRLVSLERSVVSHA